MIPVVSRVSSFPGHFTKGLTLILLSALLLLAACSEPIRQDTPTPALWQIENAQGELEGWLFGTIHALPDGVTWRTKKLDAAIAQSEWLVVEVDGLDDEDALAALFSELSQAGKLLPLEQRVGAEFKQPLRDLMSKAGRGPGYFTTIETWAAALILAQVDPVGDPANGVDRALAAGHCCVVALEGARKQLGIFDTLPEVDQRDLLEAVIAESANKVENSQSLVTVWRKGDLNQIAAETNKGMLTDPELRLALLTNRNIDWAAQIDTQMDARGPLLVAVGTAHLVGKDGLPALLKQRGYVLSRIQ